MYIYIHLSFCLCIYLLTYLILKAGKPELPLKRSKSMKSNIKPVSVIPIINQTSFNQYRYVMYNRTEDFGTMLHSREKVS